MMELNRTDLDLRCTAHAERAARANRDGWRHPAPRPSASLRARLAEGLVVLARRVDPASGPIDGLVGHEVVPTPMRAA